MKSSQYWSSWWVAAVLLLTPSGALQAPCTQQGFDECWWTARWLQGGLRGGRTDGVQMGWVRKVERLEDKLPALIAQLGGSCQAKALNSLPPSPPTGQLPKGRALHSFFRQLWDAEV